MSEYQYYEFLALDRPLSAKQQQELRAISTRADISATRFRNEYQWGDLKADPMKLLSRFFDAHVYVTNWGEHRFALRLPRDLVDMKTWKSYSASPCLCLRAQGDFVLLDFLGRDEEPDFVTDADAYMPALVPIRQMLLRGDLRVLYLGWLAAVQSGELSEAKREPPVPPGLAKLSGPLAELCEFLFLDRALLSAAIEQSPASAPKQQEGFEDFIKALPVSEKNRILLGLLSGTENNPAGQLLKLYRKAQTRRKQASIPAAKGCRSVGELLQRADEIRAAPQRARKKPAPRSSRRAATFVP